MLNNKANRGPRVTNKRLFILTCLPIKQPPWLKLGWTQKCTNQTGKQGHQEELKAFFSSPLSSISTSCRARVSQLAPVQSESSRGSIIKSEVCSVWALGLVVISFYLADSQSGAGWIACERHRLRDPETKPGDGGPGVLGRVERGQMAEEITPTSHSYETSLPFGRVQDV